VQGVLEDFEAFFASDPTGAIKAYATSSELIMILTLAGYAVPDEYDQLVADLQKQASADLREQAFAEFQAAREKLSQAQRTGARLPDDIEGFHPNSADYPGSRTVNAVMEVVLQEFEAFFASDPAGALKAYATSADLITILQLAGYDLPDKYDQLVADLQKQASADLREQAYKAEVQAAKGKLSQAQRTGADDIEGFHPNRGGLADKAQAQTADEKPSQAQLALSGGGLPARHEMLLPVTATPASNKHGLPECPLQPSKAKRELKMPVLARALVALTMHPSWNNRDIADYIRCHVKTLSRLPQFKEARKRLKGIGQESKHRATRNLGPDGDLYEAT
jgi:hypothetical protein